MPSTKPSLLTDGGGLRHFADLDLAAAKEAACPPSRQNGHVPNGWRKSLAIWILLTMTSLTAGCAAIDAPVAGCEWIRPIILDEDDRLTNGTKRAVLAHNEAWTEFCK